METYDYLYKIVLIGDSGVGKTNILNRLVYTTYSDNLKATIGVEFGTKTYKINGKNIKLQIWDTAGQERYRAITSAYYRGAHGALIVFDLNDISTFKHAMTEWNLQLKNSSTNKDIIMYLIGNKLDLKKEISNYEAERAGRNENMKYYETSAKNNEGIENVFKTIVEEIHYKNIKNEEDIKKYNQLKYNNVFKNISIKNKKKKKKKLLFWCC